MAEEKQLDAWERFKATPVVRIGNWTIDLKDLKPFTMGDKKRLKKDFQISLGDMDNDPEKEARLAWFILQSICPGLTIEEVDNLPITTCAHVQRFAAMRAGEVDRDFLQPSISSAAPTAGQAQS